VWPDTTVVERGSEVVGVGVVVEFEQSVELDGMVGGKGQ
jgi:hypothetical protein